MQDGVVSTYARERLIVTHLPLAHRLARQHWSGVEPLEDLQQVASLGLVKAVDCFDQRRRVPFVSYAIPKIRGEIWRYLRDYPGAVRIPRPLQELQGRLRRAQQHRGAADADPSASALAAMVEDNEETVRDALSADQARFPVSLEQPTGPNGTPLGDYLGAPDEDIEAMEEREFLHALLATLPETERRVIQLTVLHELPQRAVADRVGVSQMQVSRLRASALQRLRRQVAAIFAA